VFIDLNLGVPFPTRCCALLHLFLIVCHSCSSLSFSPF
jgi:hypothetical protein